MKLRRTPLVFALGFGLLAGGAAPAEAQTQNRRVLTQDDYDSWRSIQGATLSHDGRWAAYTLTPQVGEGELVVRSTQDQTEHRVPRGYTGRPQMQPGASPGSGFAAPAALRSDAEGS